MQNLDILTNLKKIPILTKNIFYSTNTSKLNLGINKTQEAILMNIVENPEKSMTEIKRNIGLDKSSFTRAIEKLCKEGFVEKVEDIEDKRKLNLAPTKKGIEIGERIEKIMDEYLDKVSSLFSEEEREEVVEALSIVAKFSQKIDENINFLKKGD